MIGYSRSVLIPSMGLTSVRALATSHQPCQANSYKLLVVGGGAGGCSVAAKFASKLGKGRVGIIEPNEVTFKCSQSSLNVINTFIQTHYYQPMWTLVGAGLKKFAESGRPMKSVLPPDADWVQDKAVKFNPDQNKVTTANGSEISYEYLVVAMGLQLNYHLIPGLEEALLNNPKVCSNYHPRYVQKTNAAISNFQEGVALFTFPNTPVKCAGAPQKIMYIAEGYWTEMLRRELTTVEYHTSLPVLFGVKKYADTLNRICQERHINIMTRSNLVEVRPDSNEALFQNLDKPEEKPKVVRFDFLHATPPMSPPDVLKACQALTDSAGFLDVDKDTLRHKKYQNVFGVGDCMNSPNAKTAAAVASQLGTLRVNLGAALEGKTTLTAKYDGYTSCPLTVGKKQLVLAEFDAQAPPQPLETFPYNQANPSSLTYLMKVHAFHRIYWWLMLRGYWEGPKVFRRIFSLIKFK